MVPDDAAGAPRQPAGASALPPGDCELPANRACVNNRFALWVHALYCESDEEAIAIRGPNLKRYVEDVRMRFAPWIDGKPPKSYQWFMKNFAQGYEQMKGAIPGELVKGGGACIGSPATCRAMLQVLADAGVDEVMLFMQSYTTRTTRSCARSNCLPARSRPQSSRPPHSGWRNSR